MAECRTTLAASHMIAALYQLLEGVYVVPYYYALDLRFRLQSRHPLCIAPERLLECSWVFCRPVIFEGKGPILHD